MRFTKQLRAKIIAEFAAEHGGTYDPALFLAEVQAAGDQHPAHAWFEWDDDKAAGEYRLWQARVFAQGIKVTFRVDAIGGGSVAVRQVEMPLILSPLETRGKGGGYVVARGQDKGHMRELCRQAAADLAAWLRRYGGAAEYAGIETGVFHEAITQLEVAAETRKRPQSRQTSKTESRAVA